MNSNNTEKTDPDVKSIIRFYLQSGPSEVIDTDLFAVAKGPQKIFNKTCRDRKMMKLLLLQILTTAGNIKDFKYFM